MYFGEGKIIDSAEKGAYLIDMTTTSPQLDMRISETASPLGFHVLDAPVTGGDRGAKAGTLSILVGGEREDCEACMDIFEAMGSNITYYGPSGAGQHAKLANQIMQASIMSGVCEALAYVREQGLDPEVFMKGAAAGAGQNALLESYGERICKDDLEPGFFVDFFIKDMKLAYDSAKLGGLELDVLGRVIENYQQLSDEGLGRAGMQALIKHYEK